MASPAATAEDFPIQKQTLGQVILGDVRRAKELFIGERARPAADDMMSLKFKLAMKINDEYSHVRDMPPPAATKTGVKRKTQSKPENSSQPTVQEEKSVEKIIDNLPQPKKRKVEVGPDVPSTALALTEDSAAAGPDHSSMSVTRHKQIARLRGTANMPMPDWHAPWKLYRVVSGHVGWVRSLAFDPTNEWFATGAADHLIKIWDLASGTLKLSLSGHINTVRGLAVSERHPYLFSCGDDKLVKCWDLEQNKVIRHYHGHLSGIFALCLHPTLDVLFTAGRDSVIRVWDIRTKAAIHVLEGHQGTVCSIDSQGVDPQIISGSADSTVKLWDLAAGKVMSTLTHHKKSVRALRIHPSDFGFVSCSADNIKKFKFPDGKFLHNFQRTQTITHCCDVTRDNVVATGCEDGTLKMWDWKTGYNFQIIQSPLQSGSLASDAGVLACGFDKTGSRLVTCESDKTIKMYKEDLDATPESFPIDYTPELQRKW